MSPARKKKPATSRTVDPAEQAHFAALQDAWWAADGELAGLHAYNPVRLNFILEAVRQGMDHKDRLNGLKVLDIGCGGGILSEGLARLGAEVTGLDVGVEAIEAARRHAQGSGLNITYHCGEIEDYRPKNRFDVVIASEVIEHVADPAAFVAEAVRCLQPGGVLVITTFNRTLQSLALGIGMAEYVLGLAPRGTHQWDKFIKPSELAHMLEGNGLAVKGLMGARYNPLSRSMRMAPGDLSMNYMLWAQH